MQSQATTVSQYLAELPDDRREIVKSVRQEILKNLPSGYEEGMQYGMIGYYVPHSLYPAGYHCNPKQSLPFANLASQKQYVSVYLYCVYSDEKQAEWFRRAWEKTGRKLNMGKSCVRLRKLEDIPLKVIGQAVKRVPVAKFIATYEAATGERRAKQERKRRQPVRKSQPRESREGRRRQPARRKRWKQRVSDKVKSAYSM